jgi:hypothetical protein
LKQANDVAQLSHAFRSSALSGSRRIRFPVAAKMALAMAGASIGRLFRRELAGTERFSVFQHGAGSANSDAAAEFGPGHA